MVYVVSPQNMLSFPYAITYFELGSIKCSEIIIDKLANIFPRNNTKHEKQLIEDSWVGVT